MSWCDKIFRWSLIDPVLALRHPSSYLLTGIQTHFIFVDLEGTGGCASFVVSFENLVVVPFAVLDGLGG